MKKLHGQAVQMNEINKIYQAVRIMVDVIFKWQHGIA